MRVHVLPDEATWTDRVAAHVVGAAGDAAARGEPFRFVLTGGGSPLPLYRALAAPPWRDRIDWGATEVFMGDERCVPPSDEGSNWGTADRLLLSRVPIPDANRHRMEGELDPEEAARRAEADLQGAAGDPPALSLVLLGMGGDGHVASLFPGSPALDVRDRLVVPAEGPPPHRRRLTMTLPALLAARSVAFLVRGGEKAERVAEAIRQARRGDADPLPAARVLPPGGEVHWFLDRAAAAALDPEETA